MGRMLVGTSGYTYKDWRPDFYPDDVPDNNRLEYYSQHFPTVEINSTYYRIPHPRVMAHIAHKTPPGYDIVVKANKEMTHGWSGDESVIQQFKEAMAPLREVGKLGGVLFQFPWRFKNNSENWQVFPLFRRLLPDDELFVEFRHASWLHGPVAKILRDNGFGYCNVDEPKIRGLLPPQSVLTSEVGYVRFHSRDASKWWKGDKERYDYLYSEGELREWLPRIEELAQKAQKVYVFFNNCHAGQAVKSARMMMELMGSL